MNRPWLVANWKLQGDRKTIADFLKALEAQKALLAPLRTLWLPPFPYLSEISSFRETRGLAALLELGAQTVSCFDSGAHTGEVSARMLSDLKLTASLVGHSERRTHQGEGLVTAVQQTLQLLKANLLPILCVGSTADSAEELALEVAQIFWALPEASHPQILLAYEPNWAIGQKKACPPDQLENWLNQAEGLLNQRFHLKVSREKWLYGGSVHAENATALLATGIGGLLVGQASWEAESLLAIASRLTVQQKQAEA